MNHSTSSSLVTPPITILAKTDTGPKDNYWQQQYQRALTNVKQVQFGPQIHILENSIVQVQAIGNLP